MSEETNPDTVRFCSGHPLEYAVRGVSEMPSSMRRRNNTLTKPISKQYGTPVSDDTANVVERLHSAIDGMKLVESVKAADLDDVEDYTNLFTEQMLDDISQDEADLGAVMQTLDVKLHESLASRDTDISKVSKKKHRKSVYIPDVINNAGEDGDVYMAKTLSTTAKVRMAHDLHDDNQVVVVDDYEKWENLLGWKKLKSLPHGKNKIKEELGDQLSDDVLKIVASQNSKSTDTDTKDTSSGGRRTRTNPTDEILNVARNSSHRDRFKQQSKDILEDFEEDGYIGNKYNKIKMLILFPSTTDLNMTNHWWVAGTRWSGGGHAAIANCNKGTFEYLNQRDEVWHIEDYLEQAGDYEFETNHGPVTMDTVDHSSLVVHILDEDAQHRFMKSPVIEQMPSLLPEFCDDNLYRSPPFCHPDDMLYAPITMEDVFWMRPELVKQTDPEDGDAIVLNAESSPRDLGKKYSLASDYRLYSRARLHEWDFDSVEMDSIDDADHYFRMHDGGYEMVETLAMLHDEGKKPFSKTPKARWDQ